MLTKKEIMRLLSPSTKEEHAALIERAAHVRNETVGNKVYLRGLIEYSNICAKNCCYCGIRRGNAAQKRYTMTNEETLECARFAYESGYGSIVIQAGERSDRAFVDTMAYLLKGIKKLSGGTLGITLSLGEQTDETYRRWFEAGAHRYLLRIETSSHELYAHYHPDDGLHTFAERLAALRRIRNAGYQTGTGVMIGLPGQTIGNLADDLVFIRDFDADMVGMGPYIEHENTPLYDTRDFVPSRKERLDLSLRMVAVMRLMMPDINIAATTAMQTLDPSGREKAILAGANIIMPNLTPVPYREKYLLYEGKPCLGEDAFQCANCIRGRIESTGASVCYGEWGDSRRFMNRKQQRCTE